MSTVRIKRIDPMQAGKVVGVTTALIFFVILIPVFLILLLTSGSMIFSDSEIGAWGIGSSIALMLGGPIIYGLTGFVMGVISAYVYNVVVKWTGGYEFEIEGGATEIERIGESYTN